VSSPSNWNPVCNSGLALAALATGKEDTSSRGVFAKTMQSMQTSGALNAYAPDGAYGEGIGYWGYSSQYLSVLASSMQTAFGEDFDLSRSPGFSETGMFGIHSEGPLGRMANYGDAREDKIYPSFMTWLSQAYNKPVYAWFTQKHSGYHPLELLWYDSRGADASPAALPKSKYFRGPELAMFRNQWLDSNASYLTFKAGNPKNEHSHLDVGSFIFDALGKRWAMDLGPDSYALPNYFIDYFDSSSRFTYYRVRAEGHNTLTINPGKSEDQEKWPDSRIIRFDSTRQTAVGDIGAAYAATAVSALRGVSLEGGTNSLVQDEIQLKAPGEIWWRMHTEAAIAIAADGKSATLTQGTKRVWVALLSPSAPTAKLTAAKAAPLAGTPAPGGQDANKNVSVLALRLTQIQQATIVVWMVPLEEGQAVPAKMPTVVPLGAAGWPTASALVSTRPGGGAPGVRWAHGNLHATVGAGEAGLQFLDMRGAVLKVVSLRGPGEMIFPHDEINQRVFMVRLRQGGSDRTLLLSRP
jgi:Heparinase II/III-like protein